MASYGTRLVFGFESGVIEWGIGDDERIPIGWIAVIAEGGLDYSDSVFPRRVPDIHLGFFCRVVVNLDSVNQGIGETLGKHESDKTGACADVKDSRSGVAEKRDIGQRSPRNKNNLKWKNKKNKN